MRDINLSEVSVWGGVTSILDTLFKELTTTYGPSLLDVFRLKITVNTCVSTE